MTRIAARSASGAVLLRSTSLRRAQGSTTVSPVGVLLVLHGGPERGLSRVRWWMPQVLGCRLLARSVQRAVPKPVRVLRLQYAKTGWNDNGASVIADAWWALAQARELHPGLPVVLVGHSMGGRIAVRCLDGEAIAGVVGLAPWLPAADPVEQLAGKVLRIVHGAADREIPAPSTETFLERARLGGANVTRTLIQGGGHAMVRKRRVWYSAAAREVSLILDPA